MRVFLSLDLPDEMTDAFGRLQDRLKVGRIVEEDDLHLTLAFLGDVDLPPLEELNVELEMLRTGPIWIEPRGLDTFGSAEPRSLHVRVAPTDALLHLQRKVATKVRASGIDLPHRRFVPHVTLARFSNSMGAEAQAKLGRFLQAHNDFAVPAMASDSMSMVRSTLGPDGSRYDLLESYALA